MKHLVKLVTLLSLLASPLTIAKILPFKAEYQADFKGIPLAKGQRQLLDLGSNTFQIRSTASALAGGFKYDDTSRFTYYQGNVQSLGFVHKQQSLFSSLKAVGFPDRNGGLVVQIDGKQHHFEAPENVHQLLDAAGFSVQLQNDLKKGLTDLHYHYNVIDEVDSYRFQVIGEEVITTRLGSFKTIKVEQKKSDNRQTWLWLAPDLDYHLLKAEIIRNGSTWASLETTHLDIQKQQILAHKTP